MRHPVVLATTLFSILLVLCAAAPALDPSLDVSQYAHTAWKVSEGFATGEIYSIAQTPDGYLWLGTEFGLLRFDGVRSVPWKPPSGQSLPSNLIRSLLAAHDGTLWIGTAKGLASWKDGNLTQYPQLAGQSVFRLLEDREGSVWVGTVGVPNGRLCTIQNGSIHCDGEDGILGVGVVSLYEDRKGNLWVGLADGLWRWKPGTAQFYSLPGQANGIRALCEDDSGALLIGWRGGIARFVDGKTEAYPLAATVPQFEAENLLRDRDGGFWIGSPKGLLHLHQGRTEIFTQSDGLAGNNVLSVFQDREGSIWVATPNGLDRFRDFAITTFSGSQNWSTSVLATRDGSVWVGTLDGLRRWKNGQTTPYGKRTPGRDKPDGKLNGHPPHSLYEDKNGRVWVSTLAGFGYLENNGFVPVNGIPGGNVRSIAEDTDGSLWIASYEQGLLHLLGTVVQEIPWAALGHKDFANVLAADPLKNGLWLGFLNGGIAYLKDGQIRESYGATNGLSAGRVSDLRLDQDGALWVATEGGLSRLKNGHVATFTSKNGLPCDAVHWLMEDDGHSFWLYMPCGLVRISRSDLETLAFAVEKDKDAKLTMHPTVFDSSDGVRTRAFSTGYTPQVSKSADGRLWFAVNEGVSVVDPHHLRINKLPPVHIEQITADRKTYAATSETRGKVRLPPRIRDLQVDYTALSFVAPEKVLFRYKLEGWDSDWQDAGTRRQAFYSNLPPRNYTFRVKACNNSGVWNEAGTSLNFSIDRAYYQTWWFRSLCVIVFLALLWALYRWRIHQVRNQEGRLRDVVDTIPAMAFVSLPNGYRTFVNKGWVEYTGMTVEQSLGAGWHAAVHPEDLKRVLGKWEAALSSGKPMYYEARYRGAEDGQYRWFMVRAVPQEDKRAKMVKYYFGTASDIEDRKRAEELQSQLAHINRVSMMGELSASLSHELKQPIAATVISANTALQWLNRDEPNLEKARETTARIVKYGNRAADIIDRLRSLYKKTELKHELVDVNEVIGEMAGLLRGEANGYGVSIRTDLAADLPKLMADRVQIQQVLMNLMLNAIEAMKETGGVLTVQSQLGEAGKVMISVSDTGVGLPADKVEEIFNAFVTTKPQGSGMGLAISRSIVESYCGRLWAAANDGRGATFHFTLQTAAPLHKQEPEESLPEIAD